VGLRVSFERLRKPDGLALLERAGMPEVWRRSIRECLAVVDFLDQRIDPLDAELIPFAYADARAVLLDTIPGIAELLALTIAVEIGQVSRFSSPEKLVSYGRLAPRVRQSGESRPAQRPREQVGLASARLGSGRGRPAGLAGVEPLARAVRRRRPPFPQPQLRQGRCRPQDPDCCLAHALPQRTVQARPQTHRGHPCPGKLPPASGRLTARYRTE
jgi:transposase